VCVPKRKCPSLPGYAAKSTNHNNDKTHSCHNVGNKEPANAIAHAVNKTILSARGSTQFEPKSNNKSKGASVGRDRQVKQ
jgi:hypothetical protein